MSSYYKYNLTCTIIKLRIANMLLQSSLPTVAYFTRKVAKELAFYLLAGNMLTRFSES